MTRIRSLARRTSTPEVYAALMHAVDNAADGLEEAAFLMTHLTAAAAPDALVEPVRGLSSLLLNAAQESVKMFEAASHVTPEGASEDLQDFFAAADRIVSLEHDTDAGERAVTSALLQEQRGRQNLPRIVTSGPGARGRRGRPVAGRAQAARPSAQRCPDRIGARVSDIRENLFFILPNAVAETSGTETTAVAASSAARAATMGSKASGLLRLAQLGLPVPPAFVLGTPICREYFARGGQLPDGTRELIAQGLSRLEEATGRSFGSARRPLLVSVRSGAPVSMPGMLQTILNVGLSEHNLHGLLRCSGNPRRVRDCYRRLVRDFTEVVHGTDAGQFDALVVRHCAQQGLASSSELDSVTLSQIVEESLELALALTGAPFPQDPMEQLLSAIEAVFRSWNDARARHYRRSNRIDDAMGTAVTVQAMVFGNDGDTSGAGVGFTRDPATGENHLYLDFLFNAQGEDVVSGRHAGHENARLSQRLPLVAAELARMRTVLEAEFHDMQDFEFTVESGRLYLLQTRTAQAHPVVRAANRGRHGERTAHHAGRSADSPRWRCARRARAPASGRQRERPAARDRNPREHRRSLGRHRLRCRTRGGAGCPR